MASKNCPETPRQKMIGMMYLVLTAMLALNVSNEVLNGFDMVNAGLGESISSAEIRNEGMYKNFVDEANKNPQKVKQYLDQAVIVEAKSNELVKLIQDVKFQIAKIADGKKADPNAVKIENRENIDAAGQFALGNGDDKLKAAIDKYRDFLVQTTNGAPSKQAMYQKMFDTRGKFGKTWSASMFESMPVAAVVTMLSKYQSDVRTAESETVQFLRSKADLQDYNFNKLQVIVNAESSYVLQGGTFKAKIFLAAIDEAKSKSYQYIFNGSSLGNNNQVQMGVSGVGPHTYTATVRVPKNNGEWETVTSEPYQYMVGKPSATMSNVDLNVVYRGIDNRFRISVPGVAESSLRVSADGASVGKSGDFYIVKPQRDGEIRLNVSAEIGGKVSNMGSETYRVKYLPDPKSFLQYTDGGGVPRITQDAKLSKRVLRGNTAIVAEYGEDELIKANFTVKSFTTVTVFGSIPTSGSRFNARQLSDIDQLEGGDMLIIKNIKAVGPDGKERSLTPISIQL